MNSAAAPEAALAAGRWVKLICGAGNQDLAAIEDLCAVYSLAGVHCIDVAADAAVAAAARRGIDWAEQRGAPRPWLMVSLSDGADPHFRKASFDPQRCPADCPRPCQRVCPALAIGTSGGVISERCYGCGRCLPACPLGLIEERQVLLSATAVPQLLEEVHPDAVELHTQAGRQPAFAERLRQVQASRVPLKRLAVSCGLERGSQARATRPDQQGGRGGRDVGRRQGADLQPHEDGGGRENPKTEFAARHDRLGGAGGEGFQHLGAKIENGVLHLGGARLELTENGLGIETQFASVNPQEAADVS